MDEAFDPYRKWLGIPPDEQPPNHYRLLGLAPFESDPEVIANAADARMAHLKTFQTGRYAALSQKVLNHLATAKVCLLRAENKEAYDRQLRAELEARQPPAASATRPPPAPPPTPPEVEPPPASFAAIPQVRSRRKPSVAAYLRRRRKQSRLAVLALVLLVGIIAGALAFVLTRPEEPPPGPPPEPQPGAVRTTEAI